MTACRWIGRGYGSAAAACRWLGWRYLAAMTVCLSLLAAGLILAELTDQGGFWPPFELGLLSGYCLIRLRWDLRSRP